MSGVEASIDVDVPVRVAYNQWTQFEDFPQFMEGVEEVKQITDDTLRWKAEIAGKSEEWTAEITQQEPDQRIAWTSREGAPNSGAVTFHKLSDDSTRVMLQMEYEPEGAVESAADKAGIIEKRINGDLKRFKDFIESQGRETGAWRGVIHAES
ncbi:MAG: SRPBCC family protein [Actinobacteria bacterium]|nr:SRPBCC family protein [Actinomycetota bacterium]